MTTPEDAMKLFHPSNLARPHSFHASTVAEFDQTMQKKTVNTLAISPRVLKRWVPRKAGRSKNTVHIYFPRSSQEYNPMRQEREEGVGRERERERDGGGARES